jgi:hypothetical protein
MDRDGHFGAVYAGESKTTTTTTTKKITKDKALEHEERKKQTVGKIKMCTDDDCCERVGISHRPQTHVELEKPSDSHLLPLLFLINMSVWLRVFIAIANSL